MATEEQIAAYKMLMDRAMIFDETYFPNSDVEMMHSIEERLLYLIDVLTKSPGRLSQAEFDKILDHLEELERFPDLEVYQFMLMLNSIVFLNIELQTAYSVINSLMKGPEPEVKVTNGYL